MQQKNLYKPQLWEKKRLTPSWEETKTSWRTIPKSITHLWQTGEMIQNKQDKIRTNVQYFSSMNNQRKWKINRWLKKSFAGVKKINPKIKTKPKLVITTEILEILWGSSHRYLKKVEKKPYQNKNRNQLSEYEQTLNHKQIVSMWVQPRGTAHSSSQLIPTRGGGGKVGSVKICRCFFPTVLLLWMKLPPHSAERGTEYWFDVYSNGLWALGSHHTNEDSWRESPQRRANPIISPTCRERNHQQNAPVILVSLLN